MVIAIIPARGGSNRIPRKNIKDFCGRPIIAWPIEVAKASGLFDHVIVSTDDVEIAEVAKKWGAEVPFMRPPELSDAHASTDSVIVHAVQKSQQIYRNPRYGCCIYPTSPFLTTDDIKRGFDMLLAHKATSVFPVVKYDFPIEQAFLLDGVRPCPKWPDKLNERSQDLPDYYHDAGMFYWFDVEKFLTEGRLFCADSVVCVIPGNRCQDINTHDDWEDAEIKFKVMAERRKI